MSPLLEQLAESFESVTWEDSHGQDVARVPREDWDAFARAAKEAGFEVCSDVTAVDWMRQRPERFEVVAGCCPRHCIHNLTCLAHLWLLSCGQSD